MPAVMRGGSGKGSRGGRSRGGAYTPAKLQGAARVGLKPQAALAAAAVVLAGGVVLMLGTGGRGQALADAVRTGVDNRLASMGLQVARIEVRGASPASEPDIRRALMVEPGQPIVGLDLAALRARAESVGWVQEASVLRLLPDTVVVQVQERPQLAVWQSGGVARVVDPQGHVIPEADPGRFAHLPLVVGPGAAEAAAAVLPLIRSRPRLAARTEALVRVDGRRWDIRLKDGGLIQLPAEGEDAALIQLDQLDRRARLLELGFARVDLRDPQMVAVRPRERGDGAGA